MLLNSNQNLSNSVGRKALALVTQTPLASTFSVNGPRWRLVCRASANSDVALIWKKVGLFKGGAETVAPTTTRVDSSELMQQFPALTTSPALSIVDQREYTESLQGQT